MSDVPPRPRIRPATSDDWQKDHSDRAGQAQSERAAKAPSQGQDAGSNAPDFDRSTYYEYIERHTGEQSVSKARSGNVFAPAGSSPFPDRYAAQGGSDHGSGALQSGRTGASRAADGSAPYAPQVDFGPEGPVSRSGQFPQVAPADGPSKRGNGLMIAVVVIAMIMILALVAFFGIRWLAPSSGTVPVDVGEESNSASSPSPSDTLVQPSASPEDRLDEYTDAGTEKAADLEGQWVTQVSAKDVGLEADGKTWSAQDILDEFEANRVKYPGSILIRSGDWGSYKDGDYVVTIIDTPYSEPEPALDQCRSWGLDRDHCLAKRLVKDGSPKDNSAYLDG
ncbi:MAG: protein kinase [Brevibacterium sp.]